MPAYTMVPLKLMHSTSLKGSMKHKISVDVHDYVTAAATAVGMQRRPAANLT